jgi:hypothetical protein
MAQTPKIRSGKSKAPHEPMTIATPKVPTGMDRVRAEERLRAQAKRKGK